MITEKQLTQIFPYCIYSKFTLTELVNALNNTFTRLGNGPYRAPMFLAQIGEESGQFRWVVEDLDYSAQALLNVFPNYFTPEQANEYARNPERIANRVYANRMGNGDEASGDGWKYRGRGFLQLTGKNNYLACGTYLGIDLITNPDYLSQLPGASDSAAWYWLTNNLNTYADQQNVVECTKLINGGLNGLNVREQYYNTAVSIMVK